MITIVVTHEDDQSDEFDFDSSQATISIGRRSTNDVCIPNLSVSGRHARIVFNGAEAWVEDLNSTNGTYINSRLISRQILNDRDELVIGKTRVRYENAAVNTPLDAQPADQPTQAESPNIESIESRSAQRPANDYHDFESLDDSLPGESIDETNFEAVNDSEPQRPEPLGIAPNKPRMRPAQAAASAAALSTTAIAAGATKRESSEDIFESLANDLSPADSHQINQAERDSDSDQDFDEPRGADLLDDDLNENGTPLTLSQKAKLALGSDRRNNHANGSSHSHAPGVADKVNEHNTEAEFDNAVVAAPQVAPKKTSTQAAEKRTGAVIEIRNGAKSGQTLPIDKPVTTLGRPGIQIAAIMRKPDGYFLMHIESDDSVDRPTLNSDTIGDEPMLLHSGDELNVAGIDVKFNLS